MADELTPEPETGETDAGQPELSELRYESNPKHKEPWQRGRKGSLCEKEVHALAATLLAESVLWEGKRYAVHDGKAYCAQEHRESRWHGYPVGWKEVPAKLRLKWVRDGLLSKRAQKKFWDSHE